MSNPVINIYNLFMSKNVNDNNTSNFHYKKGLTKILDALAPYILIHAVKHLFFISQSAI